MIEQRQQSLKQNTTPCHLADWAFSATHLIEHLGKTRCLAHHGMCWVNLLAALKAKSEHQICVRWMIDVRHARPVYSAGFGKGTSMVQSHASCAKNTLRLSQGEQVQDLQAALAKAVKEANYLKAHWTLAAGLPCADSVEDSFEVHWSTSLRYANVNNLRLILLEISNCKRLRGQHGESWEEATHVIVFMLSILLKVLTMRTFWMSVAVLCCFVCFHCILILRTQRMRQNNYCIHFAPKHPCFTFISSIPTMSQPSIGIGWWGFCSSEAAPTPRDPARTAADRWRRYSNAGSQRGWVVGNLSQHNKAQACISQDRY